METYHLRRSDRAITDPGVLREMLASQKMMTLALCRDEVPYLVTLNYGYDRANDHLYFHCAGEGKKIDYLDANPNVWGQILEDRGYVVGACDHAFRSVHFKGVVRWVEDIEEKRKALTIMIEHLEPDPEPVKRQQIKDASLARVRIGYVEILGMSGKQKLPATE
jgi:nitroimidazol reductase NimA-like FMN-containing flavoprotein (pyridoxamine 5'-phosphate oxidase superfamily)